MKYLLILLMAVGFISCGKDANLQGTYTHVTSTLVNWESFRYDANGNYVKISNDDVPIPDITYHLTNGHQKSITFNVDGTVTVDDYGDVYESDYSGDNPVKIVIDSQPTDFNILEDGNTISAKVISSGNYNFDNSPNNILVSSMCGDYVDCENIDPSEWLFTNGGNEGEIIYIVVREETYVKQ